MEGKGPELRRVIDLADREVGDQYNWILSMAVVGSGGAVSLDLSFFTHRAGDDDAPFSADYAPIGLVYHGYAPVVGDRASDCALLHGGKCYSWIAPDIDERPLVARLSNPGGLDFVWDRLEREYWDRFVPSLTEAQVAALERRRGEELANARLSGEPSFVTAEQAHELKIEEGPGMGMFRYVCACGASGPWRDDNARAVGDAEGHIARVNADGAARPADR